jgi:hypothetical protein
MAARPADVKYKIDYTVGGSANNKRDSLNDGGPLQVHSTHFLVKVLPAASMPHSAGVHHAFDQHAMEYVFLDVLIWDGTVLCKDFRWVLLPARVARLLAELDAAGHLDWTPCKDLDDLVARLKAAVLHLPVADRSFDDSDINSFPAEAPALSLLAAVEGASLVKGDDRTAAVDFKSMLAGYTQASRTMVGGMFKTNEMLMVHAADSAGMALSGAAVEVQASEVIRMVLDTQPDSKELRYYRPWNDQRAEIRRRSRPSKSQRFEALLEQKVEQ